LEVGRGEKRGVVELWSWKTGDGRQKLEEGRSWEIKTEELGDKRMTFGKAPTGRKLLV